MAPKAPKGDAKGGGKTARKAAKANGGEAGPGHNTAELKEALADYLKRMDALKDDQEKVNGEFAVDLGNLKEEIANRTGHTRKHLTMVYAKHRRLLKEELARKEMEPADVDALDLLMSTCEGMKGTPLFRAAAERAGGPAA